MVHPVGDPLAQEGDDLGVEETLDLRPSWPLGAALPNLKSVGPWPDPRAAQHSRKQRIALLLADSPPPPELRIGAVILLELPLGDRSGVIPGSDVMALRPVNTHRG